MTLAPQAPIGAYVLERRLALGGMAEVWSATRPDDPTGRRYALKVLLEHHARDAKMCTMFADEARIAGRLHHPNIVRVEELVVAGAIHAQVMPLVEGRDLRRVLQAVIAAGEVVPVPVAAAIGREVARALAYAHAAVGDDGRALELVHRDVSPHNVMLGNDGRVLLLDFGVALARERHTKTSQGTIKGKLAYMAPEQLDPSRGPVTARADVWSLGVVLWELLAARRLYGSRDGVELVHAVTSEVAEPITRYRPDVPPRLAGLLAAMLTREVEARTTSMEAVIEALDPLLAAGGPSLVTWAAPYVGLPARRTGVFVAPARGVGRAEDVDDTVRPTDESLATTPPEAEVDAGRPRQADPRGALGRADDEALARVAPGRAGTRDDGAARSLAAHGAPTVPERVAPTVAAGVSGARTVGLAALAAPTTALPAVDLADTHPESDEVSGSVSGPVAAPSLHTSGYDVVHSGQLAPREQLAATRAQLTPPRSDEAPTRLDLALSGEPAPTVPVELAPTRVRGAPRSVPERLEAPARPPVERDDMRPTVATTTPWPSPALPPAPAALPPASPPPVGPPAPAAPPPGGQDPTAPYVSVRSVAPAPSGPALSSIIRPRPVEGPTVPTPVARAPTPTPTVPAPRRSRVRLAVWAVGGAALGALIVRALQQLI